jgi:hypothetical protein
MKLTDVKVDSNRIEEGEWINNISECPGLRLRVRGQSNKEWRKLQSKLVEAVPRKKRINRLDYDEGERITNSLLLNACLIDWDGLTDDDGTAIPYSKEMAEKLMTDPDYRKFRDAVLTASSLVGEKIDEDVKDASGNLVALSLGPTSGERKQKLSSTG